LCRLNTSFDKLDNIAQALAAESGLRTLLGLLSMRSLRYSVR
jgi:hypothetical protein